MLKHHPELKRLFHIGLILSQIAEKEKDGIIEIPAFPALEKELCQVLIKSVKKDLKKHKRLCYGLEKNQQ